MLESNDGKIKITLPKLLLNKALEVSQNDCHTNS